MLGDTIVAISTALQEGAIAIIRLSGVDAIEIVNKIFDKDLSQKASHTITYGMIYDGDKPIDEVLVSVFKAPKSFTTEDVVEINCHGGLFVTKTILRLCLRHGARLARPGEFTQRAYLNGRIDLSQAESIQDLIEASNSTQASKAVSSILGSVKHLMEPLVEDMIQILANIEVNIDYPEYEDVTIMTHEKILPMCRNWYTKISDIIQVSENALSIKEGIQVAIIGKPNVGKSSLLNALLKEERAIVSDIQGTTRDVVSGTIRLNQYTLHLHDTAGIRETEDRIEQVGIEKSRQMIEKSQLVIVLLDGSRPLDEEDDTLLKMSESYNRLVVVNKSDLKKSDQINISALHHDIQPLLDAIEQKFEKEIAASQQSTLNNQRQLALAQQARDIMQEVIAALELDVDLDLVSLDLQRCYNSLKEIMGEVSKEDFLDELFSRFCLGK